MSQKGLISLMADPIPRGNAATVVRRRLLAYLREVRPAPGTRLATEAELVRASNLSRSTVRRALEPLTRDGWLDRRAGAGTFAGPRLLDILDAPPKNSARPAGPAAADEEESPPPRAAGGLRLAVMLFNLGDFAHDWFSPAVLRGIDAEAEANGVTIELLGHREYSIEEVSRRLRRTQPDALACLGYVPTQARVLFEADRLGIRVIVAGTPMMGLGFPAVVEDNAQATRLAVRHLVEAGHERIGLVLPRELEGRWSNERHAAFGEALDEAGLGADEAMVCWLPLDQVRPHVLSGSTEIIERYLARRKPTAVVCGSYRAAQAMGMLVQAGKLRVPGDLSLVTFDQFPSLREWLGAAPTTVTLPLEAMGRALATSARRLVADEAVPPVTRLACGLEAGETVSPPRAGQ